MKNGSVKQFKYKGYPCEVKAYLGHYNGYVDLPKTSPYFGTDYDYIPIECHGGLTYGRLNESLWRIGFDCAHYDDLLDGDELEPDIKQMCEAMNDASRESGATFKDLNFVADELKSIVDQLK